MDLEINFGRRRDDGKIIINFGEKRELLWANTRFIEGMPLEPIEGSDGSAVVLINEQWNGKIYFAKKRETWKKNDYFDFADRRFKELGITHLKAL